MLFERYFCMNYYNSISKGYNNLHGKEQEEKALLVKANCSLHGLLLDIGAGTGAATSFFAENAECIALDPSKEMVSQFQGLKVVARAEQLPFRDSCFDSVISLTALHHADLNQAMEEIERVSKLNAEIAISFFKRAKNFNLAKKLFAKFRKIDSEKDLIFIKA